MDFRIFLSFGMLLLLSSYQSQICSPPSYISVEVFPDPLPGSAVTIGPPSGTTCEFLYYELEYSDFDFTPGMGEGTLVSPVYSNLIGLPPLSVLYGRSVCDCDGDGVGDDISAWVAANVSSFTPPDTDPGFMCDGPLIPVNSEGNCYNSTFQQSLQFWDWDMLSSWPVDACGYYWVLWRQFVAPATGAISVDYSIAYEALTGQAYDDFGFAIGSNCGASDIICEYDVTSGDPVVVSGLVPGQTYHIGSWPAYYEGSPDLDYGQYYGGLGTSIYLCEETAPPIDFSLNVEPNLSVDCPYQIAPQYTLGDSWPSDAQVDITSSQVDPCDPITYTINVSDGLGNTAQAIQVITVNDDSAPTFTNLPEPMIMASCDDIPDPPILEATDNCNSVVVSLLESSEDESCQYSMYRAWKAEDPCGNISNFEQTVIISDEDAPSITCVDSLYLIIPSVSTTIATPDMSDLVELGVDNCSNAEILSQSLTIGEPLGPGLHNSLMTVTDSCGNSNSCPIILEVDQSTGLDDIHFATISLSPNPVESLAELRLSTPIQGKCILRDERGRAIWESQLNGDRMGMDLSPFESGIYLLEIHTDTKRLIIRVVKN